jgi:hypothetical protein
VRHRDDTDGQLWTHRIDGTTLGGEDSTGDFSGAATVVAAIGGVG